LLGTYIKRSNAARYLPDSSEEVDGEQQQKQCKVCNFFASGVKALWGKQDKAKYPKDSKTLHSSGTVPPRYSEGI